MDQKICLDTDVIIAILNNEQRASKFIDSVEDFEVFTTVINIFELFLRTTNLDVIENFRNNVNILNLTENSSMRASDIFKALKKKGRIIDFNDIFIASICIVNNCKLATFNKKDFENINDLKLT